MCVHLSEDKKENPKPHTIIGVIGSTDHSKTTLLAAIEMVCKENTQATRQTNDTQEDENRQV